MLRSLCSVSKSMNYPPEVLHQDKDIYCPTSPQLVLFLLLTASISFNCNILCYLRINVNVWKIQLLFRKGTKARNYSWTYKQNYFQILKSEIKWKAIAYKRERVRREDFGPYAIQMFGFCNSAPSLFLPFSPTQCSTALLVTAI